MTSFASNFDFKRKALGQHQYQVHSSDTLDFKTSPLGGLQHHVVLELW